MTLSFGLLEHADSLLKNVEDGVETDVCLRRAVSASYYALFHTFNGDAAALVAPQVDLKTNRRIQRWFEHAEMKRTCDRFPGEKLGQPLLGLIGPQASTELKTVCRSFIELQEARHSADYDLNYDLDRDKASEYVQTAMIAFTAWQRIANSAEANIFILSLLLWKNWDRDRP